MKPETLYLTEAGLARLMEALRRADTRLVAPVLAEGGHEADYRELGEGDEIALGGPLPRRSLKEFFLPPTEILLRWTQDKGKVALEPPGTKYPTTVVVGAFPCDAAALPIVDKVMDWDYHDDPWFERRKATTVISRACSGKDSSCFCTAVGLSPDATKGSDLLLVPMGEDSKDHLVQVLTETGKTFVSKHEDVFEQPPASTEPAETFRRLANEKVDGNLSVDTSAIASWLEECFEHDLWAEISQRCHGCGACAAVCPTCHCFDIVDEPQGIDRGVRRRNWDTCQTSLFTLHGAGHNPRPDQASRFRQRISHKFFIYPKRFSEILCTGCGRCARVCAAGMDLPDILRKVDALSSPAKSEATGTGGSA